MFTLALISFLAWILTILVPCVLPVLPLILAGSVGEKNKWIPLVITLSLAGSIVIFTVLLKASTILLGIPSDVWKYISSCIVFFLGLTYIFPHAWARISAKLGSSRAQEALSKTSEWETGYFRAILTGVALWPVFSSCSPTYTLLLATVFPVSLLQWIFYTAIYALWLSLVLLAIARGGQKIVKKLRPLADESGYFRRILGGILILVAILIVTGYDKKLEAVILDTFNIGNFEQSILDALE